MVLMPWIGTFEDLCGSLPSHMGGLTGPEASAGMYQFPIHREGFPYSHDILKKTASDIKKSGRPESDRQLEPGRKRLSHKPPHIVERPCLEIESVPREEGVNASCLVSGLFVCAGVKRLGADPGL